MVFIVTVVKTGNTDVVSVMVNWAFQCVISSLFGILTLNLLTNTIVAPPSNASKWQMGFNSAFKGLKYSLITPWSRVLLEKLSVSQPVKKFPAILWDPKFHCRLYKSPLSFPIPSQINSAPLPSSHGFQRGLVNICM